jgi:mono/diheme cytochrome c family protein
MPRTTAPISNFRIGWKPYIRAILSNKNYFTPFYRYRNGHRNDYWTLDVYTGSEQLEISEIYIVQGENGMKKILKWFGIVLGALLVLLILVIGGLAIYAQSSFKRAHQDRPLYEISADTSPQGLERGQYLMEDVMFCTEACHSEGNAPAPLAGMADYVNEGPVSFVFAPSNITQDPETGIGNWSDAEIGRAIREGIDKDGVGMLIMPSHNYHALSDQDLAAVIGYLRSVEPVRNEVPPLDGNIVAKIMSALGMFGPNPVGEPITEPQVAPQPGTVEYGAYLVRLADCSGCHGLDFAGGPMPMAAPDDPIPANLTPAGKLANWTEGQFIAAVYAGFGEGGRELSANMPRYEMTEADLRAIFAYLQTIPAVESK